MCYKSVFILGLLVFASTAKNNTKDVIGFPESEENPDLKNKDNTRLVPCVRSLLQRFVWRGAAARLQQGPGWTNVDVDDSDWLKFAVPVLRHSQAAIGFLDRKPVYIPSVCPENELFYPGDQKDDWICDCRPSYLYHPPTDACWPSFQRGPCPEEQYLTLPENSVIPTCEKNPCKADGYVLYNSKCERLGSINPCTFMYPIPAALGVNATSMVVSCVRLTLESRFGEVRVPQVPCAPGSKKSVGGKCVPIS